MSTNQTAFATALLNAAGGDVNKLKEITATKRPASQKGKQLNDLTMKEGDYDYNATVMGQEGLRKLAREAVHRSSSNASFLESLRLIKDISTINNGDCFHKDLVEATGIPGNVARANEVRTLRIDIASGRLVTDPDADKRRSRVVKLVTPLVSYSLLQSVDGEVGFLALGCTDRTVYMFLRHDLAYSFVIDNASLSAQEAILRLYVDNLNKGKGMFYRTAEMMPGFFWKAFSAVYPHPVILNMHALHSSGNPVAMKLYLDPRYHDACMVSVNGWVFGIDLNEYPLQQISRGYNMKAKADRGRREQTTEQRREQADRAAGRPSMNAAERKRLVERG